MMLSVMTSDTTATQASVLRVPEDLVRAIEDRYGLRSARLGERLTGGYANELYRLESDRAVFAVRLELEPSPAGIEWEHAVVTALAAEVPEIPPPVPALDGKTWFRHGELAVWLLPFVDGVPADRKDEGHRIEAARLLARLHAARLGVPPRPDVPPLRELVWPHRPTPEPLRDLASEIDEARAWGIEIVAGLRNCPLVTGVIHGDFFRGNVLVVDDRAVGLVDWEEATVDWQIYDLANAVWEFSKLKDERDDYDRAAGDRFVAAYREAGGTVPPDEDDLLVPLIRVRRIMEVVRAPTDRHVDWEYQRHNVRSFRNLGFHARSSDAARSAGPEGTV
jgi:Ser/Thr protein kinase RdoA (MazF antagonist)